VPRFDQIELQTVDFAADDAAPPASLEHAPRLRRLLALITDLSLFAALALALSPLLPAPPTTVTVAALAGFVFLVSFYYFAGMWVLWGATIGGTIFDVKVIAADHSSMSMRRAALRWAGLCLSLLTAGVGFMLAALPSRLSLADRLSRTRCISSA